MKKLLSILPILLTLIGPNQAHAQAGHNGAATPQTMEDGVYNCQIRKLYDLQNQANAEYIAAATFGMAKMKLGLSLDQTFKIQISGSRLSLQAPGSKWIDASGEMRVSTASFPLSDDYRDTREIQISLGSKRLAISYVSGMDIDLSLADFGCNILK